MSAYLHQKYYNLLIYKIVYLFATFTLVAFCTLLKAFFCQKDPFLYMLYTFTVFFFTQTAYPTAYPTVTFRFISHILLHTLPHILLQNRAFYRRSNRFQIS